MRMVIGIVRIRNFWPGLSAPLMRRVFAHVLLLWTLLISPEGFCARLPGMGLREGVTDWQAYLVGNLGAVTKMSSGLEVVGTHPGFSEEELYNSSLVCAGMSVDENWLFVGGYLWPTGYFSAISTTELYYVQGPMDRYGRVFCPDIDASPVQFPLARFPEFDIVYETEEFDFEVRTIREHLVTLIAPIAERFVYVMDDSYRSLTAGVFVPFDPHRSLKDDSRGSHPRGIFLHIDPYRGWADFMPQSLDMGVGPESIRVSPDRNRFVVLSRDNVARLFSTSDGQLLKESTLPRFGSTFSPDEPIPGRVFVYGYDVDWETEQLDVWWTRMTAERPLERVLVRLGENEVRVQEASGSPWPDTAFVMEFPTISDASQRRAYQLYFNYMRYGKTSAYPSECLTPAEARFFSELMRDPARFASIPDEIEACFLSPDGRYFFCEARRPVAQDQDAQDQDTQDQDTQVTHTAELWVIDAETGEVALVRELPHGLLGVYFDSGRTKAPTRD